MTYSSESHTKFLTRTLFLYFLAFGVTFLFLKAYFWDDWYTYFNQNSSQIANRIEQSGFNPIRLALEGYLNDRFFYLFRVLIFLFYPVAAFFLYEMVRQKPYINLFEARAITILFLLCPIVSARAAVILFMYTSCMCAFYIAWSLYSRYNRWYIRFVSYILFLYSFDTASTLPFTLLPLIFGYIDSRIEGLSRWMSLWKQKVLIGLIPTYWFVEPLLNPKQYAVRDSYYVPTISGLLRSFVFLLPIIAILVWGFLFRKWNYTQNRGHIQILFGLFATWLAAFPYISIGHFANLNFLMIGFVPGASDWDSRHQLLMGLGISVTIVGLINYFQIVEKRLALLIPICLFTVLNISYTQEYYLDYLKQQEVIDELANSNILDGSLFILIDDQSLRFNARGRSLRTFEWNAILRAGDEKVARFTEVSRYIDCTNFQPDVKLTITATNGRLRTLLTRNVGIELNIVPVDICK